MSLFLYEMSDPDHAGKDCPGCTCAKVVRVTAKEQEEDEEEVAVEKRAQHQWEKEPGVPRVNK